MSFAQDFLASGARKNFGTTGPLRAGLTPDTSSEAPTQQTLGGYSAKPLSAAWHKEAAFDIFGAPLRGITGAAMDVYGLADTLTGDVLPDWTTNPMGESKNMASGFIEGTANFLTGFIPVAGVVGKLGAGTRLASKAGKLTALGNVTAGAVADFAVFDGNEARLSNLIQDLGGDSVPVVGAITGFLAADEDDPELIGRLKNAIEGGTIGEALGWAISGALGKTLASQKAYRKGLKEGLVPEEAAKRAAALLDGLEGDLAVIDKAKIAMVLEGKKVPQPKGTKAAWELTAAPFEAEDLVVNGKKWDADDVTLEDWDIWARGHGFENFGSKISEPVKYASPKGGEVAIPGGVDGDRFSLVDMLEIHRLRIDPSTLDAQTRIKLYNKMGRTNTPLEGDIFDTFNRFAFGILSNGQDLGLNSAQGALVRARSMEDIQRMAGLIPWKAGEKVDTELRKATEIEILKQFGMQKRNEGGLGLRSRGSNMTALAEFAQNYLKDPTYFQRRPGESQFAFADRVSSVSWGMQSKVANFSTVWFNPVKAMGGALDRHMVRSYDVLRGIFPDPERWSQFTANVVAKWNEKGGVQFHDFDIFMDSVARGDEKADLGTNVGTEDFLTQMVTRLVGDESLTTVVNRIEKGRIYDPEYLTMIEEAQKGNLAPFSGYVRKITSEAYFLGLRNVHKVAQETYGENVGTFMAQWLNWDLIRGVIEPHETMVAGLYKLPRPPQALVQRRLMESERLGLTGPALKAERKAKGEGKAWSPPARATAGDERELQRFILYGKRTEEVLGRRQELEGILSNEDGRAVGGRGPSLDTALTGTTVEVKARPDPESVRKTAEAFDSSRLNPYIQAGSYHADLTSTLVLNGKSVNALLRQGVVVHQVDPMVNQAIDGASAIIMDGRADTASILDRFGPDVSDDAKAVMLARAFRVLRHKGRLILDPMGDTEGATMLAKLAFGVDNVKLNSDGLIVATKDLNYSPDKAYKITDGRVDEFTPVTGDPYRRYQGIARQGELQALAESTGLAPDASTKPGVMTMEQFLEDHRAKATKAAAISADVRKTNKNLYSPGLNTMYASEAHQILSDIGFGETPPHFAEFEDIIRDIRDGVEISNKRLTGAAAKLTRYIALGDRFRKNPQAYKASEWFVGKLHKTMLSDLLARVGNAAEMNSSGGNYTSGIIGLIQINSQILATADFDRTFIHEMWHHFETFVDPKSYDAILKQYEMERLEFINRTGIEPSIDNLAGQSKRIYDEAYKFTAIQEWFAETMMERTMKRFNVEASIEALDGAAKWFAKMKLTLQDMMTSWRMAFGNDAVDVMFARMMQGAELKKVNFGGIPSRSMEYGDLLSVKMRPLYTELDPLNPEDGSYRLLQDLGHTPKTAQEILDAVDKRINTFNEADVDLGTNPRNLTAAEALAAELAARDSNLTPWETPDSAKAIFRTYELLADEIYRKEVGTTSFAEMAEDAAFEAAELVNVSPDEFYSVVLARAGQDRANMKRIYSRLIMYKQLTAGYGNKLYELAKEIKAGNDTTENIAKLVKMEDFYYQLVGAVKSITSETGKSLVSNQVKISMLEIDPQGRLSALQDIIDAGGGLDAARKRIDEIIEAGEGSGAAGVTKVVEAQRKSYGNMLLEYWMNSILSGARTMVVNGLGGAMMSYYRPLELMLGAKISQLTGNKEAREVFDRAFLELRSIHKQFKEGSRMARAAWNVEDNILMAGHSVTDIPDHSRNAITARNMGLTEGTKLGNAADSLGKFIRLPSRVLGTTDEFWKQVNYRAVVEADLVMRARADGLDPKGTAKFVAGNMEKIIGDGQAYASKTLESRANAKLKEMGEVATKMTPEERQEFINKYVKDNWDPSFNALSQMAMKVADQVSFTTKLENGSIPWRVQQAVNHHPLLRVFLPFVRTPYNIAEYSAKRLGQPVGAVLGGAAGLLNVPMKTEFLRSAQAKLMGDVLSNDKRVSSEAVGRLFAGAGALVGVYLAADSKVITGHGPSDPETRALLMQSGWQPYSFKVGNGYVSYQRLDPFAGILGTVADALEYSKWLSPEDEEELGMIHMGMLVAMANNFTNKTYTTGIQNLVEALGEPDKYVPKLIERYSASMVPNIMGQSVTSVGDDYTREVRGALEAMRAKVPFYADGLPYVRNILGKKVEKPGSLGRGTIPFADAFIPLAYREVSNDIIYQELADLGHGFTPPRAVRHGIDLRSFKAPSGQTAYDRWLELSGQATIQGRDLESALLRLIKSREYQQAPVEPFQSVLESPRISMIQRTLSKYQAEGYRRLLREFPDLREQEQIMTSARMNLKRGIENIIPERP